MGYGVTLRVVSISSGELAWDIGILVSEQKNLLNRYVCDIYNTG